MCDATRYRTLSSIPFSGSVGRDCWVLSGSGDFSNGVKNYSAKRLVHIGYSGEGLLHGERQVTNNVGWR